MTQMPFDRRAILRSFPAGLVALLAGRALGAFPNRCAPTEPDIQGPFYAAGAPRRTLLAASTEKGERLRIRGRVLAADCTTPLAGALLDVWQADADGNYHDAAEQYRLRAQILTDTRGRYEFETIRPGNYRLEGGWRPAHIHFTVSAPDHRPVTTQLYFRGDRYLAPHDACGDECHSNDPHRIVALEPEGSLRSARFEIVLTPVKA